MVFSEVFFFKILNELMKDDDPNESMIFPSLLCCSAYADVAIFWGQLSSNTG